MKKTLVLLTLITLCSAAFGWDLIRQAVFPANFYTLEKIGNTIWAGGSSGGFVKSTDDGLTWAYVESPAYTPPTYKDVWGIDFINQQQGIMVGDDGMVALTTDGGATWNIPATVAALIGTTRMYDAIYHEDGKIWACGYTGTVIYSADHGVTWSLQGVGVTAEIAYGMSMNEAGVGFIVLNNGNPDQSRYLSTTDFGATWVLQFPTITGNPTLYMVRQFGNKVVFTGDKGYLGYSNDNGNTWTHYPNAAGTSGSDAMRDVIMNGDVGYAVGRNSRLLKTTDGWQTYTLETHDFPVYFEGILYRNDGSLLACGWLGTLAISNDAGITWDDMVPSSVDIWKASVIDANIWYAVGDKGLIIKTTDGGQTFVKKNIPGDASVYYACYFKNANEGWVTGKTTGLIYRTTDGGDTWTSVTIPGFSASKAYHQFFFFTDMIGYVLGVGGKVAKTIDGGVTWNVVGDNINTSYSLYCNYWKSENNGYAGSGAGRLFITENGGVTWNLITVGNSVNINDICFRDANNGVLVNAGGQIFYTTTGGNTVDSWIAASEQALDDLYSVTVDHNGVYWAAGYSSDDTTTNMGNSWAIMKSIDNGATWTQETFPALTFNSTRFTGISIGGGKIVAVGKNNLVVAQLENPEHVTLTAPLNNITGLDPAAVTLSWTPSPFGSVAEYYQVLVSDDPALLYDQMNYETSETSFNLSAALGGSVGYSTRYYWAVLPVNADLATPDINSDDFMVWRFLTMDDPSITELETPVLSIEKINDQVRLTWAPVLNAHSYRVYGASTPDVIDTLLTTTANTEYIIVSPGTMEFFKVIADTIPVRK